MYMVTSGYDKCGCISYVPFVLGRSCYDCRLVMTDVMMVLCAIINDDIIMCMYNDVMMM